MFHNTARWWLLIIVIAAAALRLALALVLPFDAGPDERWRFDVVSRIHATGRAPRYGQETGHHYVVKPIFGLRFNAYLARAIPGELPLFRKLRFGSLAVSLLTVLLAYAAARNLWPAGPKLALGLSSLLAFHPQFIFLGSYLNHDAYTIFANALVFYLLTVVHRRGRLTAVTAAALGAALGLVFLGRENGYAGFVLAAGYGLYLLRADWRLNGRFLAVALAVFLVFPAAFYFNQYAVYGKAYIPVVVGSGIAWVPPGVTVEEAYAQGPPSLAYWVFRLDWRNPLHWLMLLVTLFTSSFAVFGYMDVEMPWLWYSWYLLLMTAAAVGLGRQLRRGWRVDSADSRSRRWLISSAAVAIVALLIAVIRHNFRVLLQPQGRYLLPLLVPEMLLLLMGWRQVARRSDTSEVVAALGIGFFVLGGAYAVWMLAQRYV